MDQQIPPVNFNNSTTGLGIDIVSIEKLSKNRKSYEIDPGIPHQLKFYNFIFFTEGAGRHFVDFKWYPVQKNTLVYMTQNQINAFDFNDTLKGFCIIFTETFFVQALAHLPKDIVFRLFNPQLFSPLLQIPKTSDFMRFIEHFETEYFSNKEGHRETILEALFVILVSKAETIKQDQTFCIKDNLKVKRLHQFTELVERYYTHSRNAVFYAEKLNISYKHLNAISKELLGKTAKNLIDDYIILQAKRRLINTSITIAELSYELGFEDPTNFNKYFKNRTNTTPKHFRKEILKN